jgi:AmmeMemoRadiSam system protein A
MESYSSLVGKDPFVSLAKKSLQSYLKEGKVMEVPANLAQEFKQKAGAFVSLKKQGKLRGCIGTFLPTKDNIAAEVIANAVSAGLHDPRFSPVQLEEVDGLDFSVDVLSEPEKISDLSELDPKKYGVLVKRGGRTGLLLPMLEGVNTIEEQVHIAMQKAGIRPDEEIEAYRFTVTRHI